MMDSSPQSKNPEPALPMAGTKRPAPSLLPAFEPLSSSPGFPRPSKRQARPGSVGGNNAYLKYPTPIPTSSTGILSSSPPRVHHRSAASRAVSAASERTPLGSVPSIELNENGETLLMGRSSNSSDYQLSANRLISRVHIKARFVPAPSALEPNKIEILCNGWNGLKLHCQGRTWELLKGDSFTSETEGTEIMLDVHDARVMIQWPKRDHRDRLASPESQWDDSPPRPNGRAAAAAANLLQSSPLRRTSRIESPDSPTPAHMTSSQRLQALLPTDDGEVHIYEDSSAEEPELPKLADSGVNVGQSFATEVTNSFSSDLSEPEDENYPDEENDPIVHSFGPFGADISNRLASVLSSAPKYPSSKHSRLSPARDNSNPSSPVSAPPKTPEVKEEEEEEVKQPPYENSAVRNHVVNQLAFSRLSSNPLSTIMNNLPTEEKKGLAKEQLRSLLENTACIGIITRQGKDAAGKPLESEYYYVPEADDDEQRRFAVTDGLRKPSLRACRKQHKVRSVDMERRNVRLTCRA